LRAPGAIEIAHELDGSVAVSGYPPARWGPTRSAMSRESPVCLERACGTGSARRFWNRAKIELLAICLSNVPTSSFAISSPSDRCCRCSIAGFRCAGFAAASTGFASAFQKSTVHSHPFEPGWMARIGS